MRGFVQKRVKQACLIVFCRKHARKISEKIGRQLMSKQVFETVLLAKIGR